jgi:curved DNA-binding protein CbpA
MSTAPDYYQILHVRDDAPTDVIRSSYRAMMQRMKLHPDLGGDHDGAALLNEAYTVLSDPTRRAAYDRDRAPLADLPATQTAAHSATGVFLTDTQLLDWTGTYHVASFCLFCSAPRGEGSNADPNALCAQCNSPVHPAERRQLEQSIRRMGRVEREYPIDIFTRWDGRPPLAALMQDLSLNGMRFSSKASFHPQQLLKIDSELCRSLARVAYSRNYGFNRFVTGVEFATIQFPNTRGTFVSAQA